MSLALYLSRVRSNDLLGVIVSDSVWFMLTPRLRRSFTCAATAFRLYSGSRPNGKRTADHPSKKRDQDTDAKERSDVALRLKSYRNKDERNRPHNHKRDTQRLAFEKLCNEALCP